MNFITTPILKLTTWVKRHPIATLLVLILIFLAPPFIAAFAAVIGWVFKTVRTVKDLITLPQDIAAKVEEYVVKAEVFAGRAVTWLAAEPERQYYLGAGLLVLNPFVGAVVIAWAFLDKFKKSLTITTAPSPAPPPPDIKLPEPDLGDILDDYFGGIYSGQV